MNTDFTKAINDLRQTTESFKKGATSPIAHGTARGGAICAAVVAMAKSFDVTLKPIGGIDSRGDIHITAAKGVEDGTAGCGRFGAEFAEWLNTSNVRTGLCPPAHLSPDSGWCIINHFDAERMILRYAESLI